MEKTAVDGAPEKALDGAIVNGHIFVVGGVTNDAQPPVVVGTVETRRTAGRGEWQSLPPMTTARGNPAAAALDGMVYVAGGGKSGNFLKEVERFDPRTRTWTSVPSLPKSGWKPVAPMLDSRARHKLVAVDGYLYAIGGENDENPEQDSSTRARRPNGTTPAPTPGRGSARCARAVRFSGSP